MSANTTNIKAAATNKTRWFNWSRIFGYDFFISFKLGPPPIGAQSYASDLARRLRELDFTVFFSEEEAPPGEKLDTTLVKALHRSRILVVVANDGALVQSQWVRKEVEEFRRKHPKSPVIPINVDRAIEKLGAQVETSRWLDPDGRIWFDETRQALDQGIAGSEVLKRLEITPRFMKANTRLRWATRTTILVLLTLTFWALWQRNETMIANKKVGEVQQLSRHTSDIGTKPQRSLLLSVRAAALSEGGQDENLDAIDALRQQLRATGGRPLAGHEKSTRVAAFSFDRHWLATGSDDGAIRLWDLHNADLTGSFLPDGHMGPVHGLAFSPDGTWLVSGGGDGAVRLWRMTAEGATPGPVFNNLNYGTIHSVAISPKNDWLVFGTQKGNVCIWKMSAEGPLESPCEAWKGQDPVMNVVFSPKGRWLATTCSWGCRTAPGAKEVNLWDLSADFPRQEPKRLRRANFAYDDSLLAIAFNGNDKLLAVAYNYLAEVWDLTQENPPQHVVCSGNHTGWIRAIGISPDNRWLATGSGDPDVKLWDLTDACKEPIVLKGHSAVVNSVIFSDDGWWLASAADDATARLWDLSDPTIPSTLLRGQESPVKKVIFSPGVEEPSHLVTVGEDQHARLWNIPDPLVDPVVLRPRTGGLTGTAVSPDGAWIASSGTKSSEPEGHELLIWSIKDPREPVHHLPIPGPSDAIAFSADGRWLAAKIKDKGGVILWSFADLFKPIELSEDRGSDMLTLGFSPDSWWLVSGTKAGAVNIWDVSGDSPSVTPRYQCIQNSAVHGSPAFSSDGRFVGTGSFGAAAYLWDLKAADPCHSPRALEPHGGAVYEVALSRDSRWAATASTDGKGRLWDLKTGSKPKFIRELEFKDQVVQAAFDPNGRWAAFGSWDNTIQLLDLKNPDTSKPIVLSGHAGRVTSILFSPNSQWLVTGSDDQTIRLWNPADPSAAPVVLRGHEASISLSSAGIGFSEDNSKDKWVVTSSYFDETIRLWRLRLYDLRKIACQTAGRDLTPEEAKYFLGEEDAPRPCTGQQTVDLPGPDDSPQAAAILSSPGAGKAPSAESASAPTEAPGPAVTAPPATQP